MRWVNWSISCQLSIYSNKASFALVIFMNYQSGLFSISQRLRNMFMWHARHSLQNIMLHQMISKNHWMNDICWTLKTSFANTASMAVYCDIDKSKSIGNIIPTIWVIYAVINLVHSVCFQCTIQNNKIPIHSNTHSFIHPYIRSLIDSSNPNNSRRR